MELALRLLELLSCLMLAFAFGSLLILYMTIAKVNRLVTEDVRAAFYEEADRLLKSGELPPFHERLLLILAENMFSIRGLFGILRQRRMSCEHRTKVISRIDTLRTQVPDALQASWDRAILSAFLAVSSAEPIMGFLMRGKLGLVPGRDRKAEVAADVDAAWGEAALAKAA